MGGGGELVHKTLIVMYQKSNRVHIAKGDLLQTSKEENTAANVYNVMIGKVDK